MSLHPFNTADDIVEIDPTTLVTSTWSNNTNDLNIQTQWTASSQGGNDGMTSPTSSGTFFIDVYNTVTGSSTAEVQFSLAYGNHKGSGSPDFTNDTGSLGIGASRVTYGQYRNLIFDNETSKFTFGNYTPDGIYVINVNRSRYKQQLSPGSLNLHISGSPVTESTTQEFIHLTDDSVFRSASLTNPNYVGPNLGGYYHVVSGSNGTPILDTVNQLTIDSTASCYGFFYPKAGLIILNGDAFSASIGTQGTNGAFNTGNQTTYDKPHQKFFDHMVAGGTFIVDSEETINSTFYFVRAKNSQFNYTNNASFVDEDNRILHASMKNNPKVFITTVGLYNTANELVAVAKLSQPVAKDFTKEALVRVKLDY